MYRKTEARINLNAIRANLDLAGSLAPGSQSVAVIKADAYGHGMLHVAAALQDFAPAFAVATIDEALELRESGIRNTVLVLQGATSATAYKAAAANGLTLVVHTQEQVKNLLAAGVSLPVWLKIDSGMHRLGLPPGECADVHQRLLGGGIDVQVVCTHFSCADDLDSDATAQQIERFSSATASLGLPRSLANSAAILTRSESHAEWIRPGYMLYGNSPFATDVDNGRDLQPAMSLQSEVISIREVRPGESVGYGARWTAQQPSIIGTVAIGYGDGYPRHAPNGTPTGVNGRVAPLVGRVSMDSIAVDLTGHSGVAVGDRVELWGESIAVNEVAAAAGTIGYELLTGVSSRVPRIYA